MGYTVIKDHIAEIYQLEVSEATISSITDQLIPQLKAWQSRPLDSRDHFYSGSSQKTENKAR